MDRAEAVHQAFLARVTSGDLPETSLVPDSLTPNDLLSLYRTQCASRHLDRTSRAMQRAGQGFYTIGSSGHEGMAAVAHALRPTDMAFLHYRDAAFQIARADQVPGQTAIRDILLSFAASSEDPISGGRHKVLGSRALNIPPQTSTIASHLPKAVGAAYSIGLAKRLRPEHAHLPEDSLILCSFGDASANHSTAQGAINAACWSSYQNAPMPVLFVCEDNGLGISVPTPAGWIAANFSQRPGLRYFACDGLNLSDTFAVAKSAADYVRRHRKPAFLHVRTVRLYGHAGSDVEATYRHPAAIQADEANDPLLHSVRLLQTSGAATPATALQIYSETDTTCQTLMQQVVTRPRLQTATDVMASLIPPPRHTQTAPMPSDPQRTAAFGSDARSLSDPQPMARLINWALTDLMLQHPEIILAGEDIGRKGGVYGVTQKLQNRFGRDRMIDTLLDEQSILGLSIGLAHNGFVPIPEIQFLAYLHNAEDQLRGEAATLSFFSNGQYTNPMVVRIAGLGYQKGFGGHFHNDNSLAVLRDIPGLILACPSRGDTAAGLLREAVRLAREEQRIVVLIEPIALYQTKDLISPGDTGWLQPYPDPQIRTAFGTVGCDGQGTDIALVSYGNGHFLCKQAAHDLSTLGFAPRVIDLRWLAPLPEADLLRATAKCDHVLIVDECRRSGSVSEALMALFAEAGRSDVQRLAAEDSFIATGPAYAATLPSRDRITTKARDMLAGR